jgi:hypothetical protein
MFAYKAAGDFETTKHASTPYRFRTWHPPTSLVRAWKNRKNFRVTKEQLRVELEKQANRFKNVYGGEITTYAAQPDPDKKPWRKKQTIHDQVFQKELEKIERELAQQANDSE